MFNGPFKVIRAWRRDTGGQSIVEFALVIPIFLFLFFSIVTIGYWMNAQQIVTNAAREGARIGSLTNNNGQIEAAVLAVMAAIDTNRDRITIFVDPLDQTSPLRARGNPLTVRIEYQLPISFDALPQEFRRVASQSVSRMEFVP